MLKEENQSDPVSHSDVLMKCREWIVGWVTEIFQSGKINHEEPIPQRNKAAESNSLISSPSHIFHSEKTPLSKPLWWKHGAGAIREISFSRACLYIHPRPLGWWSVFVSVNQAVSIHHRPFNRSLRSEDRAGTAQCLRVRESVETCFHLAQEHMSFPTQHSL